MCWGSGHKKPQESYFEPVKSGEGFPKTRHFLSAWHFWRGSPVARASMFLPVQLSFFGWFCDGSWKTKEPGAPKTMKNKGFHLQKTWFLGTKNMVFDGFGCSWYLKQRPKWFPPSPSAQPRSQRLISVPATSRRRPARSVSWASSEISDFGSFFFSWSGFEVGIPWRW